MDTPLPNPSSLGDIYNQNPGAFSQAQDILNQGMQGSQLSQLMNQQTYDQNAVMNPLRAQSLAGANAAQDAQLPGITAKSSEAVRADSNQAATNDAQLKDTLGKLSQADRERHIQDIDNAGELFRQQGALAFANPIGAAQRAKAELAAAGHGDMWNSDWDNLNPGQLAQALSMTGQDIGKSSSKMMQLSAGIEAKNSAAQALEQTKQQGRMAVRASINQSAADIESARQAGANSRVKMSSDQAGNKYVQLADQAEQAGDDSTAQAMRARAQLAFGQAERERAAGTEAGNQAKPALEQLTGGAVPTMKTTPTPAIPPMKAGLGAPPAPQDVPSQVPNNPATAMPTAQQRLAQPPQGRVRIFDPRTGQAHTVPNDQADEAQKQGYVLF